MSKPRVIAFYLPQFHPTPDNDRWWGKGFTEWTNVGKAKPLFRGHYQPKVPADLGYYDLRLPEVREQQAELARQAGIEGFCYWHYWFGGRRMLDRVFTEVVESKKPDFPFCLCWANHSWYKKTWDANYSDKLLIEQTYPGEKDYEDHFYAMLPAFKDSRYMTVNGKLIFGIFDPNSFPKFIEFKNCWNKLASENGLKGFCFVAYNIEPSKNKQLLDGGFDKVAIDFIKGEMLSRSKFYRGLMKFKREYLHLPQIRMFVDYVRTFRKRFIPAENIVPVLVPNFDHSPRSGSAGIIYHNSTPTFWEELCDDAFEKIKNRPHEENLVFIKAWNEWGEGNYLEPDLKFGCEYLTALKESMEKY